VEAGRGAVARARERLPRRAPPDDDPLAGLARAAELLFGARGAALLAGGAFGRELKRAFKRRALETHPDRARALGRSEEELAREFLQVVEAYRLLERAREVPSRAAAAPRPAAPRPAAGSARPAPPRRARRTAPPPPEPGPARRSAAPAAGPPGPRASRRPPAARPGGRTRPRGTPPPDRRVRMGEWLYYTGRIPFDALVEALAWQRSVRPRVGRLAVECGFLSASEVTEVLARRRAADADEVPFAEYATRIGLLTPFERLALLAEQGRYRRRIGSFFVERGWLEEAELDAARLELWRHNARYPEP
jgi:hypothetical protein